MIPIKTLTHLINSAVPYAWDDSESWYEFLGKVLAKVNELVTASNEYFDFDYKAFITTTLETWINNGTIAELVTNALVSPASYDNLRIAFHFNYENNQAKLTLLKQLGFNCIWLYQQQDFTKDPVRLAAFLDMLSINGLRCIVQVDQLKINEGDIGEIALVNYVKSHNAVIGFTGYDEAIGHGVPAVTQEAFYNAMKTLSSKLIFQVDNDTNQTTWVNYYTPNSYDVLCVDAYLNLAAFDTELTIKAELFKKISSWFLMTAKTPPKFIIPIIPMFSGEGFTLPTNTLLKYYKEVFSIFDFLSWGAFAFHIMEKGYETMDSSYKLKELAMNFNSVQYRSRNNFEIIKPKGFAVSENFVSTTGFVYDANYGFEKIATVSGEPRNNILILKLYNRDNSTLLAVNAIVKQAQDAETRHFKYSISYDNSTYGPPIDTAIGAAPNGVEINNVIAVERYSNVVYLKIELDCTGVGSFQIQDYIGITAIGYGFV